MTDILKRLNKLIVCEPGCEGRCRECPQDVVRDAINDIEWLRQEIVRLLAEKGQEESVRQRGCNRFRSQLRSIP